ncbi:hypothetical protein CHARACLAT_029016 [Characodon lateralis]|uniref:Uncharacterized protein n=1 Tax=Characodon lateralis TaxID=208331 RepID=A0ABU7CW81_9TELE|nr:hypothetical protein [Characodon lateralis]
MSFDVFKQQAASISPLECQPSVLTLSRTFGVPELQTPHCYCSTGLTLRADAKCLLLHSDSTEPVHPPLLSSDPAPAPYYHSLLHTPVLEAFILTTLCAHSGQSESLSSWRRTHSACPAMYQSI